MEVSKHGSPVFIGVIRGLFYSLFWIAYHVPSGAFHKNPRVAERIMA